MTIYTTDTQLGVVGSSGVFTVGTRYGADSDIAPYAPQIVTPVYNMKYEFTFGTAALVVTPIADTLDWYVQANVNGGWFRGYIVFGVTVNSGAYANNNIDAEVYCYAGINPAELVTTHDSNPVDFSGPDPNLSDATTPDTGLAIGETKWFPGAGTLTYQTGYFSVMVAGTYQSGISVDAYFRLKRLRWGDVIIWDANSKGLHTSNVKYG